MLKRHGREVNSMDIQVSKSPIFHNSKLLIVAEVVPRPGVAHRRIPTSSM